MEKITQGNLITKEQLLELSQNELPHLRAFYSNSSELEADFNYYLSHYLSDSANQELINVNHDIADNLAEQFESHFKDTAKIVFDFLNQNDFDDIYDIYKTNQLSKAEFKILLDNAKWELIRYDLNKSMLCRYDASVDVHTGIINGMYEINADTPTMLFESVILQNNIVESLDNQQNQYNEMFGMMNEKPFAKFKNIGVVCDTNYTEDMSTAEVVAQLLEIGGNDVYFTDIKCMNHNLLNLQKPFFIDGVTVPMDIVYILLPWEEMVKTGKDILGLRESMQVEFIQPAFMWFIGHKATQALITQLHEDGEIEKPIGHLTTHFSPDYFIENNLPYVSKPVIGRFSQSVKIHKYDGNDYTVTDEVEGPYSDEYKIYQEYCPPVMIDEKSYIFSPWMTRDEVSCFSFRRFSGNINDDIREYFIPHMLKD